MKRCPTCNRTFDEDWLAFCTQDGTTLIEEGSSKANEPPATILAPPPAPPPGDWQQPSGGIGSGQFQSQPIPPPPPPPPSNFGAPSGGIGSGQFQPGQQMQSGWQPPPPPTIQPKQGIAVASMICGIVSVTIGWCCYIGVLTAPVAIGLGIFSLSQIKKDPEHNTGKPFALIGIIAGAVYFLGIAIIILIYGMPLLAGGLSNR